MKIEACHITMQYKQKQVLKDINFTLEGLKSLELLDSCDRALLYKDLKIGAR